MTSVGALTESIVTATARHTGTDETTLPPLYDVVDPDAIGSLVAHSSARNVAGTCIEFSYAGCRVVVDGDGSVAVRGPEGSDSTAVDDDDGASTPVTD